MAKTNKIQHTKERLLDALEQSLGVVTTACKKIKINRSTFYQYLKDDPKFAAAVSELENVALDFVESQLHKQIHDGIPSSTIFYLKTKGKKRGYIERVENINVEKQSFSDVTDEELQKKIDKLTKDVQ